jgi:hypothetical protein
MLEFQWSDLNGSENIGIELDRLQIGLGENRGRTEEIILPMTSCPFLAVVVEG